MTITQSITIDRPVGDVFHAITDPSEIIKHFPLDRVESDGRAGGVFVLHGKVGDEPFTDFGRITELKPDTVFAYRYWSTNHGSEWSEANEQTIRYRLKPADGSTVLSVEHSDIGRHDQYETMSRIWPALLDQLKTSLENGS